MTTQRKNAIPDLSKEPVGGELAIRCLLVENQVLVDLLDLYAQERGAKIRPALTTAKFVWVALANRQFWKKERKMVCCDETIDQITEMTGLGFAPDGSLDDNGSPKLNANDAITNALAFLDWAGFVKTIKRGGGKNKLATVRKVYSTTGTQRDNDLTQRDIPRRDTTELNGNIPNLDGNTAELDGNTAELDGVLPVTPSDYQDEFQNHFPNDDFGTVSSQDDNPPQNAEIELPHLGNDNPAQSETAPQYPQEMIDALAAMRALAKNDRTKWLSR